MLFYPLSMIELNLLNTIFCFKQMILFSFSHCVGVFHLSWLLVYPFSRGIELKISDYCSLFAGFCWLLLFLFRDFPSDGLNWCPFADQDHHKERISRFPCARKYQMQFGILCHICSKSASHTDTWCDCILRFWEQERGKMGRTCTPAFWVP